MYTYRKVENKPIFKTRQRNIFFFQLWSLQIFFFLRSCEPLALLARIPPLDPTSTAIFKSALVIRWLNNGGQAKWLIEVPTCNWPIDNKSIFVSLITYLLSLSTIISESGWLGIHSGLKSIKRAIFCNIPHCLSQSTIFFPFSSYFVPRCICSVHCQFSYFKTKIIKIDNFTYCSILIFSCLKHHHQPANTFTVGQKI